MTPTNPRHLLLLLVKVLLLGVARFPPAVDAQQQNATASSSPDDDLCTSPTTNTFHVKVDLFAGELGYFTFEECGNRTMPTIGIEVGQTYTFVQTDPSNYYHPMGFAYYPDGAHDGKIELEPTVAWESDVVSPEQQTTAGNDTNPLCASTATCPTPLYFEGDTFLGNYSNLAQSFGLDVYEPLFYHPVGEWDAMNFSVRLNFDDVTYGRDIFYFCHVHQFMSGRIKLLRNGVPINSNNTPPISYAYDAPGEFDASCGTYGLEDYRLPNAQCPSTFVCGVDQVQDDATKASAPCYDAFNCAMMAGMTTGASSGSEIALFIHHMIPHHQNAVNMAKTLLKLGGLECDDLFDEEKADCIMTNMMRDTINSQNQQIQTMRGILDALNLPADDDCVVTVTSSNSAGNSTNGTDSGGGGGGGAAPTSWAAPSSRRARPSSWMWLVLGSLGTWAVARL